jgi:hypothetical protein
VVRYQVPPYDDVLKGSRVVFNCKWVLVGSTYSTYAGGMQLRGSKPRSDVRRRTLRLRRPTENPGKSWKRRAHEPHSALGRYVNFLQLASESLPLTGWLISFPFLLDRSSPRRRFVHV